MTIENRIAKLEEHARGSNVESLSKAERDAKHAAFVEALRPVAATCATWQDLARYLGTLEGSKGDVISLEDSRRQHALNEATARSVFEEVNG